jgi:hypothetical protein
VIYITFHKAGLYLNDLSNERVLIFLDGLHLFIANGLSGSYTGGVIAPPIL